MKAFLLKSLRFVFSDTFFLLLIAAGTLRTLAALAGAVGELRQPTVFGWAHVFTFVGIVLAYFYTGVVFARRKGVKRG